MIFSLSYDAVLFAIICGIAGVGGSNGDPILLFVLFIVLTPYLAFILPGIYHVCRKGKFHKKRWMSRDVEMFGFKGNAKTNQNLNPPVAAAAATAAANVNVNVQENQTPTNNEVIGTNQKITIEPIEVKIIPKGENIIEKENDIHEIQIS